MQNFEATGKEVSIGPRTKNQHCAIAISKILIFVKQSNMHFMVVRKAILKVGQKFNILGVIKQILFALHSVHLISIVCKRSNNGIVCNSLQ